MPGPATPRESNIITKTIQKKGGNAQDSARRQALLDWLRRKEGESK